MKYTAGTDPYKEPWKPNWFQSVLIALKIIKDKRTLGCTVTLYEMDETGNSKRIK